MGKKAHTGDGSAAVAEVDPIQSQLYEGSGAAPATAPAYAKAPESKSQRFRRLAERRMPKAKKAILAVGNLSGKSSYQYSEAAAAQLVSDLRSWVEHVATLYAGRLEQEAAVYTLPE